MKWTCFTLCDVDVLKLLRTVTFLRFLRLCSGTITFRNYRITFSDATLSDVNVVWCYVCGKPSKVDR